MTHVEKAVVAVTSADDAADIELEARWDLPAKPARVAILCHPHPLQRGNMNAPLMQALTDALVHLDFAVLRFNFRGVGRSTGTHDHGDGEMDDVAAAVATASDAYSTFPIGVAGWSFGAVTSLHWQARDKNRLPWVGIAPPVNNARSRPLPPPDELADAPRTLIIGDRDQFTTVADTEQYATAIGADLDILKGSDHFFYFREERVAGLVAAGLSERV
jgi:alpha/beta superfamily hydrolase